jgi:hypothetical protein
MDLSQSKGEWKIERATHVPLTLGGKAKFMIANVLSNLSQLCLGIQNGRY